LETAIKVTSAGRRPASCAALAMAARTSLSLCDASLTAFAIGRAMFRRHPPPRVWLMTDERLGDGLFEAIGRLPAGAGIVFRHYSLPEKERRALFDQAKAVSRPRGLKLLLAGPSAQARAWGADGSHGRGRGAGFRSAPAHNLREIRAAERAGANLLFLSPVYTTRSHAGGGRLGSARFTLLARQTELPVVALGGMTRQRAERLRGAYGWAAIDFWSD
jgi:thiamine-phosphate pyrophosphorylase